MEGSTDRAPVEANTNKSKKTTTKTHQSELGKEKKTPLRRVGAFKQDWVDFNRNKDEGNP